MIFFRFKVGGVVQTEEQGLYEVYMTTQMPLIFHFCFVSFIDNCFVAFNNSLLLYINNVIVFYNKAFSRAIRSFPILNDCINCEKKCA